MLYILYRPWCGYSKGALEFTKNCAKVERIPVKDDVTMQDAVKEFLTNRKLSVDMFGGHRTAPAVMYISQHGGVFIGGYNELQQTVALAKTAKKESIPMSVMKDFVEWAQQNY
jgi:hypothetical protein